MKYKFPSPRVWLYEKLTETNDIRTLRSYAYELLLMLDSDQIQDVFQEEMDRDGYFDIEKEMVDG